MIWASAIVLQNTENDLQNQNMLHTGTESSTLNLSMWLHSFTVGDIRNDLYLTLEKGDFERGGKSVQKNIEVTMYVLYADGEILKVSAYFLWASGTISLLHRHVLSFCCLWCKGSAKLALTFFFPVSF